MLDRGVFEAYRARRVRLNIDFPAKEVDPFGQPLTNVSWVRFVARNSSTCSREASGFPQSANGLKPQSTPMD